MYLHTRRRSLVGLGFYVQGRRMKLRLLLVLAVGATCALAVGVGAGSAKVTLPWQSGIRAVGNGATIEPAVDLSDGTQTFLITPNNSPLPPLLRFPRLP